MRHQPRGPVRFEVNYDIEQGWIVGLNCAWDFPQYKAIPIATTPFWAMKALNLQEGSPTQFMGRTMMQFRTHRGND